MLVELDVISADVISAVLVTRLLLILSVDESLIVLDAAVVLLVSFVVDFSFELVVHPVVKVDESISVVGNLVEDIAPVEISMVDV